MDTVYAINELFRTIQGEAFWGGTPSVFVRLQGCDVGCPWCDTKHTWTTDESWRIPIATLKDKGTGDRHPDDALANQAWAQISLSDLVAQIVALDAPHVVLTGGEPAMQDLDPLCRRLLELGKTVQIETSGTYPLTVPARAWVTVSPKIRMPGKRGLIAETIGRANEIKHPVGIPRHVTDLIETLGIRKHAEAFPLEPSRVWLQPIDGIRNSLEVCLAACYEHGFRLSVQTHKLIGVR